jgi:hypothetical protein
VYSNVWGCGWRRVARHRAGRHPQKSRRDDCPEVTAQATSETLIEETADSSNVADVDADARESEAEGDAAGTARVGTNSI